MEVRIRLAGAAIGLALVGCSGQTLPSQPTGTLPTSAGSGVVATPSPQSSPARGEHLSDHLGALRVYPSKPDSAGGVDVHVELRNMNSQEIKYVYFSIDPYNAVNDVVESEIGGRTTARLRVTGPVGYHEFTRKIADVVWYNPTIVHLRLTLIEVEYANGVTAVVNGADLVTDANGNVTDKDQKAPSESMNETKYLETLKASSSRNPELEDVPEKDLLIAGKRMCSHPDYDGITFGEDAYVKLPKSVPESLRPAIWAAVVYALCPA